MQHDWMCGISINTGNQMCIIFSVYLPYQSKNNEDQYVKCLSSLHSFIDDCDTTIVVYCGTCIVLYVVYGAFLRNLV